MCPEGILINDLINSSATMAQGYFFKISDLCLIILTVWFSIWAVWKITFVVMGKGVDTKEVYEEIFGIIIASSILSGSNLFWDTITTVIATGVYMANMAISGSTTVDDVAGVGGIFCQSIGAVDSSFGTMVKAMIKDFSIFAPGGGLWIILMVIAISFLMVKMLKYTAEPMFGTMAFMILSPVLVLFSGISALRKAAWEGFKYLLTNMLELILNAGVAGIIVTFIAKASDGIPFTSGQNVSGSIADYLGSPSYFSVLFMLVTFYFAYDRIMQAPSTIMQSFQTHMQMNISKFLR